MLSIVVLIYIIPEGPFMTIRHLRIFLTVCQNDNNVTKAGAVLYMSQPSVSAAIRELETHYNTRLFDRIGKRLYRTAAGDALLRHAEGVLARFSDMEKMLGEWSRAGEIRVGASLTAGRELMPDYVLSYQALHQETRVRVHVAASRILEKQLLANEIDLAIVEIPTHHPMLHAELLFTDSLEVIAPRQAPYLPADASFRRLSRTELAGERFLLREKGSGTRDIFDRVLADAGIVLLPIWESESVSALLEAVVRGVGLSVVPRRVMLPLEKEKKLCRVQIEDLVFPQSFYIVYHREKLLDPSLKDFIQICRGI